MRHNIVLDCDSYKASHYLQFPPGTEGMFSYLEARGGRYDSTVFFGLQYFLETYLAEPVTVEDVIQAKIFWKAHGEPFNFEGWMRIAQDHLGLLPIQIKAVPEGYVTPHSNVLLTVESTDPQTFWIVNWLETMFVRLWYPITVATTSWHCKRIIRAYLEKTSDDPAAELPFKLHDFGSRGATCNEAAALGGAAHLVNFQGSDTVAGVLMANSVYAHPMSAFSIPAAEHATVTAWGRDGEVDAYRNMLTQFAKPGSIVAVVSDSYDIFHACTEIWGKTLKNEVIKSGATVVVRPDSGDPPTVVLECLVRLEAAFGSKPNSKGYKVLNHVRVLQGDGNDDEMIQRILETITKAGFSATNVAFGMGGGLLQKCDRDTHKFAFKCSAVKVKGLWRNVSKNPVGDSSKKSKAGRLALVLDTDAEKLVTVPGPCWNDLLQLVYLNGDLKRHTTLDEIRKLSESMTKPYVLP